MTRWQCNSGVQLGSMAAAQRQRGVIETWPRQPSPPPCCHRVLPAMKTPAATAMTGAQTINNQLKAVMVRATEMVTMTATIMTMETKGTAAAAEAWRQRRVPRKWWWPVWQWRQQRRWRRKLGKSVALAVVVSLATEAAAWQERGVGGGGQLGGGGGSLARVRC